MNYTFVVNFLSEFGKWIDIVCVIVTLMGCVGVIASKKKRIGQKILFRAIIILAVAMLCLSKFYVPNLSIIPEIENVSLDTAKTILSERELSYEIVNRADYQDVSENLYIVSLANKNENTYIYKNSKIQLKIVDLKKTMGKIQLDETIDWDELDAYSPDEVQISDSVKRINFNVRLSKILIKWTQNNGMYIPALTEQIGKDPDRLYLYDIENHILYKQYKENVSPENEMVYTFENIPYGDYMILAEVQDYIKLTSEVIINGNSVVDGQQNTNLCLQEKEAQKDVYFTIQVMDENNNGIKDAQCLIYNDTDGIKHGYWSDESGNFTGIGFAAPDGMEFNVRIDIGTTSYEDIRVRACQDTIILVVKKDGTVEVTDAAAIYNY